MIILSFDIGIKNLAYCLVDISNNKLQHIFDWGIVNLISDNPKINSSQCGVQGCSNRAAQRIGTKDKTLFSCRNKRCGNFVLQQWQQNYPKSKAKLVPYKPKKATAFSLIDIGAAIRNWLTQKKQQWIQTENIQISHCLLEHQPVFKNPVMKSVEMILVGVIIGMDLPFSSHIEFVHADKKTSKQASYGDRKRVSIETIEELMKTDINLFPPIIKQVWMESRKRDDLADTVNQAIAWTFKQN